MAKATVSGKGQVVIPAAIRRSLGIKSGTELGFEMEGTTIRVTVDHAVARARIDDGYGLLKARRSRKPRRLSTFDAAEAMRRRGAG